MPWRLNVLYSHIISKDVGISMQSCFNHSFPTTDVVCCCRMLMVVIKNRPWHRRAIGKNINQAILDFWAANKKSMCFFFGFFWLQINVQWNNQSKWKIFWKRLTQWHLEKACATGLYRTGTGLWVRADLLHIFMTKFILRLQMLQRVIMVAAESLKVLEGQLMNSSQTQDVRVGSHCKMLALSLSTHLLCMFIVQVLFLRYVLCIL